MTGIPPHDCVLRPNGLITLIIISEWLLFV